MCSPEIMARVREAMAVSRRDVIKTGGIGGAAALAAAYGLRSVATAAAQATPTAAVLPGGFTSVIDLTHTWGPAFPVYYGAQQAEFTVLETVEESGFYKNVLTYDEHTGTHMDSPAHFAADGITADLIPVERLIAPLAVIDISARAATDPDAQGTVDDILAWESANGPLPDGVFVALYSGWEARLADPATFVNLDADNVQHYPGWHPDAAAFLVNERAIVGAGVDTLSLDYGPSTDFDSHLTLLPAGKFGIENLANLAAVPASGATIIVGGPKHERASGGPSRVLALF